jgi:hypothetical protein
VLVGINSASGNLPHIVTQKDDTHRHQKAQLPKEPVSLHHQTPFVGLLGSRVGVK